MSEQKYESKICSIPNDAHTVYSVLGNLRNLERVKDMIPYYPHRRPHRG